MAQICGFDLSFVRECSAECANSVTFDLRLAGQSQGPRVLRLGIGSKVTPLARFNEVTFGLEHKLGERKGLFAPVR